MRYAIVNKVKVGSAVKDLGCHIEEFKLYIENQFTDGMTWENYGEWELDHVIPLDYYNLEDRMEYLEAASYLNYQPLWKADNISKNNKYYDALKDDGAV